ncbi:hypothetical protein HELRODRAFT_68968 [Helobdella robusta]|uniref:Cyclin-like domain-containing protein n=1 Tax=Helobdella robusta TaxID=6412 RepID=T1FZM7_HELRO|nr:hypothetical protein HELRODRAFT_68968 [Helobdella robusta]ESN94347.1 hypothetical protein HELRODRAFT_68968 [Helobdella robusta]
MPCWYYEKKDFLNTPSVKQGMSPEEESKCRKDGAKFIIAACTKLGLNIVTCATGVVLFHRFYMFRSFTEFPKYITAVCCLYLAGKVEETPKKCKDLIEVTKNLLTEAQFATFGEDPKEEITTLEQIVLQTVKIDFVIEHPYTYLVKFAKLIKGDKDRIQSLLQIAWTLNNDSLCTTLSLQWEPDVIAVSLMYLACRISKFEIMDWHGKPLGFRGKWYNFFVEDVSLDLLEDICHQVLDNFCKAPQSSGHVLPTTKPAKSKSKVSS